MKIGIHKYKINFRDISIHDLDFKYSRVHDSRPNYSQIMVLYLALEWSTNITLHNGIRIFLFNSIHVLRRKPLK